MKYALFVKFLCLRNFLTFLSKTELQTTHFLAHFENACNCVWYFWTYSFCENSLLKMWVFIRNMNFLTSEVMFYLYEAFLFGYVMLDNVGLGMGLYKWVSWAVCYTCSFSSILAFYQNLPKFLSKLQNFIFFPVLYYCRLSSC